MSRHSLLSRIAIVAAVAGALPGARHVIQAQAGPSLVDQNLQVRTVATGLNQPTSLAFIGTNDLLVLEKNTGRVMRVSQRSEEHTSELQSQSNLVCRLLLEKKKKIY